MLLAFTWWSVLLYTKNRDAFRAKSEFLKIMMVVKKEITTDEQFLLSPVYYDLHRSYKRQEWMIMGEAVVFVISLVIGMWFINRGYNNQINSARQRRNFLLSITHELKSPIASIKLVLETVKKRTLPKEKVDKLATSAIQEADRLNTLVNDLLLAAKIETAYQPVMESLELGEILENVVAKLKVKFPEVQFEVSIPEEQVLLQGDQLGISSTFINLLENAVKYSSKPAQIRASIQQSKKQIKIEVADQGIGISDAEKKKVFKQFYRVGSEDTRKTKGTGLGLFIVDQIVKAHQGQIDVKDNQPQGTVFIITLPVNKTIDELIESR